MSLFTDERERVHSDQLEANRNALKLSAIERVASRGSGEIPASELNGSALEDDSANWPPPQPLPDGLPPVAAFDFEMLPVTLRRRVEDIADRIQCPADYPAVAVMVMLASLIGRRCRIAPKKADDWLVTPNLWGMVIGRPGIMKSPPLAEIMRPLQVLQARALEQFEREQADHEAGMMVSAEAERVAKDSIRKLLKEGKGTAAAERAQEVVSGKHDEPICRRHVVNDSTVEKLGEILNENPYGVLLFRDELNGFFRTLERQGHEADRAFYLECWNGDGSFTYDRIGRGTLHIAGACLSVLGSIQPGRYLTWCAGFAAAAMTVCYNASRWQSGQTHLANGAMWTGRQIERPVPRCRRLSSASTG
jgi:hypothetical protein